MVLILFSFRLILIFIYTITLEPNMYANPRKLTDDPVQKKKNVLVDRLVYKAASFT